MPGANCAAAVGLCCSQAMSCYICYDNRVAQECTQVPEAHSHANHWPEARVHCAIEAPRAMPCSSSVIVAASRHMLQQQGANCHAGNIVALSNQHHTLAVIPAWQVCNQPTNNQARHNRVIIGWHASHHHKHNYSTGCILSSTHAVTPSSCTAACTVMAGTWKGLRHHDTHKPSKDRQE